MYAFGAFRIYRFVHNSPPFANGVSFVASPYHRHPSLLAAPDLKWWPAACTQSDRRESLPHWVAWNTLLSRWRTKTSPPLPIDAGRGEFDPIQQCVSRTKVDRGAKPSKFLFFSGQPRVRYASRRETPSARGSAECLVITPLNQRSGPATAHVASWVLSDFFQFARYQYK